MKINKLKLAPIKECFLLQIQNDIVDILMAFTQPSLAKEESEEGMHYWLLLLAFTTTTTTTKR